ncbi:hypothetical protein [Metabacillus fastidiosus]|nr:hypothetical protein [Metabacillus fastidiosus]MED4464479.1 hypothetical protein [Metabacillus fastidiosus]
MNLIFATPLTAGTLTVVTVPFLAVAIVVPAAFLIATSSYFAVTWNETS